MEKSKKEKPERPTETIKPFKPLGIPCSALRLPFEVYDEDKPKDRGGTVKNALNVLAQSVASMFKSE